jgi:hypothetical protein
VPILREHRVRAMGRDEEKQRGHFHNIPPDFSFS